MKRLWMAVGLVLLTAVPAAAHPAGSGAPYVVSVEDTAGRLLRTFHRGKQTFVLGDYGARYNIRVRNQTGRRIEAVVTVDGRDVISGRQGDYARERGYIVPAYGDVLIEGFRTSEASVAAFRFTRPSKSYSARMGTPQHVGVVGVAVFRERHHRPYRRPRLPYQDHYGSRGNPPAPLDDGAEAEASAAPRPEARSGAGSQDQALSGAIEEGRSGGRARSKAQRKGRSRSNLGTEYGEHRESHVVTTHFKRQQATAPNQLIVLRYDDARGLRARGFHLGPRRTEAYAEPSPFPRNRFAPPPPR